MNDNQRYLPPPSYRRRPGLFWPILLIGAGVIFLLYNLGYLKGDPWPLLWRLWPVLLVIIGLDILLGRRSVLGGVLSALFAVLIIGLIVAVLFAAQNYPALVNVGTPELRTEHIAQPLGDVRQADVTIDFPGGTGDILALSDSPNLIEGDIRYYGDLTNRVTATGNTARVELSNQFTMFGPVWWDTAQQKWTIGLNPRVVYALALDTGSGSYDLDLRQFTLSSFTLNSGSGSVRLTLPETGQYQLTLDAGSGSVVIHVPEGVAVRVNYHAGSGSVSATGLTQTSRDQHDGTFESAGFSQAGSYVIIQVDLGSGSVTIQ
jgi:LiaI-LiaF-like transmembrane region